MGWEREYHKPPLALRLERLYLTVVGESAAISLRTPAQTKKRSCIAYQPVEISAERMTVTNWINYDLLFGPWTPVHRARISRMYASLSQEGTKASAGRRRKGDYESVD